METSAYTRNILSNGVLAFLLALSSSCVSGPKDDRSLTEKLNDENYKSNETVVGVPVLERQIIERKFSGRVFCGEGITQIPTNHALISILKESQVVSSSSTDFDGTFHISVSIIPAIAYRIQVTAPCGAVSRDLDKEELKGASELTFNLKK